MYLGEDEGKPHVPTSLFNIGYYVHYSYDELLSSYLSRDKDCVA